MRPSKMEQSTSVSSSSRNSERAPEKTGMDQVLSDLQALKGLYGLLHKGQQQQEANANANIKLDEASRSLLMRMLDDATQQALLKQAKLLSGPLMSPALERNLFIKPGRWSGGGDAEQRLKPLASPSLGLHASEWSRRLKPPQSPARSRDDWRAYDDHRRRARDDPPLARVASNRSSRTAVPRLHPGTPEQRLAGLGSYRSSYRVAEPRRDVGSGSDSRAGRGDRHSRLRRGSGRGDRSSSSSSPESSHRRRRSESRAPSTARRVGAGGSSTSRRVGRMDSRLSMGGVTSRCGSGRAARRGEATPRRSSSSSAGEAATIRSRIRPNRELMERCVRRAEEIREQSLRRRGKKDGGSVHSGVSTGMSRSSHRPRRALDRIDSGSTYSSGSSSSSSASLPPSPSTIPTAPSTSLGRSASSSSSSSVSVSPRGGTPPEYPFEEASSTSRSRRRRERQERREGRLRRFKNKLALVFHHRHDHHHHHHVGRGASPLSRRDRGGKNGKSPWSFLGGMFHHRSAGPGHEGGKKKKSTSRTVATAKRRGGGGGHSLLDALVRHKWGAPKAARAPVVRTRSLSRVQVKKMHWWQQLKQRRGRSSKPRRRLKQGKAP